MRHVPENDRSLAYRPHLDLAGPRLMLPAPLSHRGESGDSRHGSSQMPVMQAREAWARPSHSAAQDMPEGSGSSPSRRSFLGSSIRDVVFLHAQKLSDKEPEWRKRAAERLAALAESSSNAAAAVAGHTSKLMRCCKDPDESVRAAALGALEVLVDSGQALGVTSFVPDIAACLQDDSSVVCRRAASLCRAIADAGFAVFVAAHINKIVRTLERQNNAIRVTPLRALASLSSKGEARAVVEIALEAIFQSLRDKIRAVRIAACDALSCTARAPEVQDSLKHWCDSQIPEPLPESQPGLFSVLERIKRVFLFDKDTKARLASMSALAAFAEVNPEHGALFCERHREQFAALARDVLGSEGHQLQELVATLPGPLRETQVFTENNDDLQDSESDGEGQHACPICQRNLCQHGVPKALPCGHTFHTRCIDRWLDKQGASRACPLCRRRPSSARLTPLRWQALPREA